MRKHAAQAIQVLRRGNGRHSPEKKKICFVMYPALFIVFYSQIAKDYRVIKNVGIQPKVA